MDLVHKLLTWMDYNRWVCFFLSLMFIIFGSFSGGCFESKTTSILDEEKQVSRDKLLEESVIIGERLEKKKIDIQANMDAYNAEVNSVEEGLTMRFDELDRKDLAMANLVEKLGGAGKLLLEGQLTPTGLAGTLITLVVGSYGVGQTLDSRRKDKVIEGLKLRVEKKPA